MYGLIHTAIRDMVIRDYGEELWHEIMKNSGLDQKAFLTMQSYDDSVTYGLIGAVAESLDEKTESVLKSFGTYWLTEAAPKVYANLLNTTGESLFEFLENLDDLHDKITLTFTNYTPPSFKLERLSSDRARLHYRSSRQGLTPFVNGLIKGMEERFKISIEIKLIESVEVAEGEYTIFDIVIQN